MRNSDRTERLHLELCRGSCILFSSLIRTCPSPFLIDELLKDLLPESEFFKRLPEQLGQKGKPCAILTTVTEDPVFRVFSLGREGLRRSLTPSSFVSVIDSTVFTQLRRAFLLCCEGIRAN